MGTHQDQFRGFAEYNRVFNQRLYTLASELSDHDRKRNMGAFFGSIHATMNHILLADRVWLGRFSVTNSNFKALQNANLIYEFSSLGQELYSSFDELSIERRATDEVIRHWVEELTGEVLAKTMKYSNSKGEVREYPIWLVVTHMFNHQTHHRGQITTLLSQLGKDPGVTDYLVYAQNPGA